AQPLLRSHARERTQSVAHRNCGGGSADLKHVAAADEEQSGSFCGRGGVHSLNGGGPGHWGSAPPSVGAGERSERRHSSPRAAAHWTRSQPRTTESACGYPRSIAGWSATSENARAAREIRRATARESI